MGAAEAAAPLPRTATAAAIPPADPEGIAEIRRLLSSHVGVLRDGVGLRRAILGLAPVVERRSAAAAPALVALMLAVAALDRTESRGSHTRTDHPNPVAALARRRPLTAAEAARRLAAIREEGFAA
jgi:L-aspartate oxidase